MSKKVLTGAMAAIMATGMVTPALAATTDELYVAAFKAMEKAVAEKTQAAINEFRTAAKAILAVEGLSQEAKNNVATWSTLVDEVQLPLMVKVVDGLKALEAGSYKQADVNALYELIKDMPAEYKDGANYGWSQQTDKFQDKLTLAALEAVEKAATAEEIAAAQALVADLKTSVNADAAKAAGKMEEALVEKALVKVESLSAIGAKKLEVKFNKAVVDTTKLALTVKRDNVKVTVTNVEWNADKTVATLTTSYNLQDGKYSVSSVYGTEAATTVENVEVKAAKVSKISFVSQSAVMANAKKSITAKVKVENQYGEDITDSVNLSDVNVTTSKGNVTSLNKGLLTITDTADYTVDQKVVITLVHKATATVSTATLSVVQTANINSIVIDKVTTDNADLKGKDIFVSTMTNNASDFYLPLTVKDQYGNELSAADLASLTIVSSNENIAKIGSVVTKNNKPALQLATPSTPTNGTAVITVVSPTGVSANVQVTVLENGKVDLFTVEQPEVQLKKNVEATIPFTSFDQYGNALTSNTDLVVTGQGTSKLTINGNTTVSVTGGTLSTKVDYANKNKVSLQLTPSADQVIITVITATGKVQNVTWSVASAPKSTNIAGLDADFYKSVQIGQTSDIADMIEVSDQYGDVRALTSGMAVSVVAVDANSNVELTGTEFEAKTKGTTKYKVQLIDTLNSNKVVDEYEFTMEAVELKDITEFGVNDLNKHYTGATSVAHDQVVEIFGKKGSNKVKVAQTLIKSVSVTNGLSIANGTTILKSTAVNTDGADKTATLTVLVEGAEAPITLTKSVTYSSATPKAQGLTVKNKYATVNEPVIGLNNFNGTDITNGTAGSFYFELKDQYNVDSEDVVFTITNVVDVDADKDLAVNVAPGGVITITDAQGTAGDSFVINAITSNGIAKSIKVILNN